MTWKGKTEEISGGEQDTTNLRMEITAACVALERIDEGHTVTIYSRRLIPRQLHEDLRNGAMLQFILPIGWYARFEPTQDRDHRSRQTLDP